MPANLENSAVTTGQEKVSCHSNPKERQCQRILKEDISSVQFSSFQSLSRVRLFATAWIAARQASLSITNSRSSLKLMSSCWCCHPAISSSVDPFSSCPQTLPASQSFPMSQLFAWGSQSIIPSEEIAGLILFRMDWLDFLAVQGALRSLFQHHSSKASVLRHSAFFTVQLSHPYMTTGKTIALTRWTFVDKVMSVLLNISRSKILSS